MPFDFTCTSVLLRWCLWSLLWSRWLWLHDDNTLGGRSKINQIQVQMLASHLLQAISKVGIDYSTHSCHSGGGRRKSMLEKWRDDNEIKGGEAFVAWTLMHGESGSWMSKTQKCVIVNSMSIHEPNSCHNAEVLQSGSFAPIVCVGGVFG